MAAVNNIGKSRENNIKSQLIKIFKNAGFMFHQLPDTFAARGKSIPAQPSDFIVFYSGVKGGFLEFKYSNSPKWDAKWRPKQWETIVECYNRGVAYWGLIECNFTKKLYFFPATLTYKEYLDTNRYSMPWDWFEKYTIDSLDEIPKKMREQEELFTPFKEVLEL
jgi:hypothetical protein